MRAYEFITELGFNKKRTFKRSPCTKDCGGHSAGYVWASKKNITRSNQCPNTPSKSFNNGCRIQGREKTPILTKAWSYITGREL